MCKPYNEFKKILEDYNESIINEMDPIKKQELITFKRAFLWENPVMYHVYKAVQGKNMENINEVVSNLIKEDFKDTITESTNSSNYTYCKNCQYYQAYDERFGMCKRLSLFTHSEDYCFNDSILNDKQKKMLDKIDKLLNE